MNYILVCIYLFCITPATYSMHLLPFFKEPTKEPTKEEIAKKNIKMAKNFILNFPDMKPSEAYSNYNECSKSIQNFIDQLFATDQLFAKKNESLPIMLLYATTKVPKELQEKIVLSLFNNNETATNKFLNMTIKDGFKLYQWSKDVFDGNIPIPSSFKIKSIDSIFLLSDQIKKAEAIIQKNNPAFYVGREDIEILRTIIDHSTDKNIFQQFPLQYYSHKRYNWEDFKNSATPTAILSCMVWIPLTFIWMSRYIKSNWCTGMETDSFVQQKIAVQELNELICKSEKLHLLDVVCNPQENLKYSWFSHAKMNMPFLAPIPIITLLDASNGFTKFITYEELISSFLHYGYLVGIPIGIASYLCSYIPFEKIPGGFLGVFIAIPTLIFLGISAMFSYSERSWNKNDVNWNTIDKQLKRTDIFIPDRSSTR